MIINNIIKEAAAVYDKYIGRQLQNLPTNMVLCVHEENTGFREDSSDSFIFQISSHIIQEGGCTLEIGTKTQYKNPT